MKADSSVQKMKPFMSPLTVLAFAIGTSVGWGSLVVTSNTYLKQAADISFFIPLLVRSSLLNIIHFPSIIFLVTKTLPFTSSGVVFCIYLRKWGGASWARFMILLRVTHCCAQQQEGKKLAQKNFLNPFS